MNMFKLGWKVHRRGGGRQFLIKRVCVSIFGGNFRSVYAVEIKMDPVFGSVCCSCRIIEYVFYIYIFIYLFRPLRSFTFSHSCCFSFVSPSSPCQSYLHLGLLVCLFVHAWLLLLVFLLGFQRPSWASRCLGVYELWSGS